MLQNLSKDIRECYLLAEQSRRLAEAALTPSAKKDFLDMERRWLSLAHSYDLQNGYRITPHRSPSANRKKNKRRPARELLARLMSCPGGALVLTRQNHS
jgi:hypothetical protein